MRDILQRKKFNRKELCFRLRCFIIAVIISIIIITLFSSDYISFKTMAEMQSISVKEKMNPYAFNGFAYNINHAEQGSPKAEATKESEFLFTSSCALYC